MFFRYEIRTVMLLAAMALLAACEREPAGGAETVAAATDGRVFESPGKPQTAPVNLKYRLLETPQVGQPFDIELTVVSSVETPLLGFDVLQESGLLIDASSATHSASSKPAGSPESAVISVTPTHEGRFHLRVTCNVMVDGRLLTRVVPIAIQVGQGTRPLEQLGETRTDEDGNSIISLPAATPETG